MVTWSEVCFLGGGVLIGMILLGMAISYLKKSGDVVFKIRDDDGKNN